MFRRIVHRPKSNLGGWLWPLVVLLADFHRAQRGELLRLLTFAVVRRQRSDPPVKAHVPAERCSPFETGDLVSCITHRLGQTGEKSPK